MISKVREQRKFLESFMSFKKIKDIEDKKFLKMRPNLISLISGISDYIKSLRF